MEQFIRAGGVSGLELYNCSAHKPDEWSRIQGERHPIAGFLSVAWGVMVETMYIPCIWALMSKEFTQHACFKIMLVLGIVDMGAIIVNSIITGFLLIEGAVFCTHPTLIFIAGSTGLSLWCVSCLLCLVLVMDRVLELWKPEIGRIFFEGKRTFVVISMPILYGLYFFFFTPPIAFTSRYQTWFFDPFIYTGRTMEYQNFPHSANNFFIVGFTVSLYAFFVIVLGKKLRYELMSGSASSRAHKQIFIQSSIICMFTLSASLIYVLMNFIEFPDWVVKLGHMMWQMDHSSPAFIYLFANKTIRNAAIAKIRCRRIRLPFHSSGKSHQVAPTATQESSKHESLHP